MASINKINILGTSYELELDKDWVLGEDYTSYDSSNPKSLEEVEYITNEDSIKTIFEKLTKMVKNFRFIYTTIMNTKASKNHTHTTLSFSDKMEGTEHLPARDTLMSSKKYIPTSKLVYNINENLKKYENYLTMETDFTVKTTVGGISAGTVLKSTDKVRDVVKTMLVGDDKYSDAQIDVWNTKADVDYFFSTYTYENNWKGLRIGNYVTINDGIYNIDWMIADFNTETAADDVEGGIVFIPRYVDVGETHCWHSVYQNVATPYINSDIHSYINSEMKNNLSTILGSHLVNRKVKLGSAQEVSNKATSAYTETTVYLTLMSTAQFGFDVAKYHNKYDDGEANYKLKLFDYIDIETYINAPSTSSEYYIWVRNVYGGSYYGIYYINEYGSINYSYCTYKYHIRPLMYLR